MDFSWKNTILRTRFCGYLSKIMQHVDSFYTGAKYVKSMGNRLFSLCCLQKIPASDTKINRTEGRYVLL